MVTDRELSEALRALGMDRESARVLPLLPLVQVAWADGTVQEAERQLIGTLAEGQYRLDAEGARLLKNWLAHAPSPAYARRGQATLVALCQRDGAGGAVQLDDVIAFATQVARAAGGYFGLGAIEAREAQAIEQIAQALHLTHERPWVTPDDATLLNADADAEADGPPPEVTFKPPPDLAPSRGTLVRDDGLVGEQSMPVGPQGVTIGRGRENTVQISYDAQVSRNHARIFEREGKFYAEDLGSTCGTWVNGERVVERRLLGGERIHVGSGAFFFQLSPGDP